MILSNLTLDEDFDIFSKQIQKHPNIPDCFLKKKSQNAKVILKTIGEVFQFS